MHRVPIVPGESSYCVAVNKKQNPAASSSATNDQNSSTSAKEPSYHHDKTLIFTTSISKGILPWRFNNAYDQGWASFARFPGAKAEYMETYISPRMENKKPSVVILQAGGNDLPKNSRGVAIPIVTVANSIITAGLACKHKYGAQHVLIGGVTTRKGNALKLRCDDLNETLRSLCQLNNFTFIDNSDIKEHHLYDGMHLKDDGTKILAGNYLNALHEIHQPA